MTVASTELAGQSWRGDGLGGLDRGSRVWWRASQTEWQAATIVSISAKECSIALDTPAGQGTGKVRGVWRWSSTVRPSRAPRSWACGGSNSVPRLRVTPLCTDWQIKTRCIPWQQLHHATQ